MACKTLLPLVGLCAVFLLATADSAEEKDSVGSPATVPTGLARKLAQSNGRQWDTKVCISWGDSKLGDMHPHDYCDKNGGAKVCCFDKKCGMITCARGNRPACCPKQPVGDHAGSARVSGL